MTRDEELEALQRKLAASEGRAGYERRVKEIKRRIAEIESTTDAQ